MFVSLKQTGCVSVKDRRVHNFEDDVGSRVKICFVFWCHYEWLINIYTFKRKPWGTSLLLEWRHIQRYDLLKDVCNKTNDLDLSCGSSRNILSQHPLVPPWRPTDLQTVMRFLRSTATFRADALFDTSSVAIAGVQEESALESKDPSLSDAGPRHSPLAARGRMLRGGHQSRWRPAAAAAAVHVTTEGARSGDAWDRCCGAHTMCLLRSSNAERHNDLYQRYRPSFFSLSSISPPSSLHHRDVTPSFPAGWKWRIAASPHPLPCLLLYNRAHLIDYINMR